MEARQTEPEDTPFTLRELLKRSGVAAPTVHQYRRMGLLPDPARPVPNRFSTTRHVKACLDPELRDREISRSTHRALLPGLLDETGMRSEPTSGTRWWRRGCGRSILRAHPDGSWPRRGRPSPNTATTR